MTNHLCLVMAGCALLCSSCSDRLARMNQLQRTFAPCEVEPLDDNPGLYVLRREGRVFFVRFDAGDSRPTFSRELFVSPPAAPALGSDETEKLLLPPSHAGPPERIPLDGS